MSAKSQPATSKPPRAIKAAFQKLWSFTIWIFLAVLIVAMSFLSPNFLTVQNFITVLRNVSIIALLSFGLTFVFLGGGFDLSQGATLILCATLISSLNPFGGFAFVGSVILVLAVGVIIGAANGYLIGVQGLNPFIVTLGTRYIIGAVVFIFTAGMVISAALQSPILEFIGLDRLFRYLPILTLVWAVVAAACWYVIRYTPFARRITVLGSNVTVARFSGLQVKRLSMSTYAINGLLAGLAGILLGAQTSHIAPTLVWHYDFDAITACAVGGISLSGGRGSIIQTLSGVLLLGFINNSMILIGLPYTLQLILKGIVLLAAIIADRQGKKSYA
jgi:ribose transport system permease protein